MGSSTKKSKKRGENEFRSQGMLEVQEILDGHESKYGSAIGEQLDVVREQQEEIKVGANANWDWLWFDHISNLIPSLIHFQWTENPLITFENLDSKYLASIRWVICIYKIFVEKGDMWRIGLHLKLARDCCDAY